MPSTARSPNRPQAHDCTAVRVTGDDHVPPLSLRMECGVPTLALIVLLAGMVGSVTPGRAADLDCRALPGADSHLLGPGALVFVPIDPPIIPTEELLARHRFVRLETRASPNGTWPRIELVAWQGEIVEQGLLSRYELVVVARTTDERQDQWWRLAGRESCP